MQIEVAKQSSSFTVGSKVRDYMMLVKMSLSIMVVFSAVVSYLLAPHVQFTWPRILLIALGGFLVTGSANAVNQVVEKDTDALMKRSNGESSGIYIRMSGHVFARLSRVRWRK